MNLIKTKGIIIKETPYKENDKILTILTDELGKVSCIAKGAKKTNSKILANSQYLVYSEFVLYKNQSNFYYINSASIINMFYNLRIDFDKLENVFEITKILNNVTDENQDTSKVLKLFLNTIYIIENFNKDKKFVNAVFKIKLFQILGFSPRINNCAICGQVLLQENIENIIYFDYVSNQFLCKNCSTTKDTKRLIKLSNSTLIAILYILKSDIKKTFSFELTNQNDLVLFAQVYTDSMTNGI